MRRVHHTFNLSAALLNLIIIGLLLTALWRLSPNTIIAASWLDIIIAALLYWFMLTAIAIIWVVILSKAFESHINNGGIIIISILTIICAYLCSVASLYGIESLMNNFAIAGSWQRFIIAAIILHSIQSQVYSQ